MQSTTVQPSEKTQVNGVIPPAALIDHWQGHRKLTRKMIEAFPEDKLFNYSVGGMRPFAELALEMINMAGPGIEGARTGKWTTWSEDTHNIKTKEDLLKKWDEVTVIIDKSAPQIPVERYHEKDMAFGQWEGPVYWIILYWIDNEIHHRGQGYVYLRSLGIQPPAFYDRF